MYVYIVLECYQSDECDHDYWMKSIANSYVKGFLTEEHAEQYITDQEEDHKGYPIVPNFYVSKVKIEEKDEIGEL